MFCLAANAHCTGRQVGQQTGRPGSDCVRNPLKQEVPINLFVHLLPRRHQKTIFRLLASWHWCDQIGKRWTRGPTLGSRKNWSSQQSDASSHSHIHWENLLLIMGLLCSGVRRKLPVGYWLARLVDQTAATRGWLWPGWWGGAWSLMVRTCFTASCALGLAVPNLNNSRKATSATMRLLEKSLKYTFSYRGLKRWAYLAKAKVHMMCKH